MRLVQVSSCYFSLGQFRSV